MTHNLKTRPKADFTIRASNATKSQYIIKITEWAENFEEELQQKFDELEATKNREYIKGRRFQIQQVLGKEGSTSKRRGLTTEG